MIIAIIIAVILGGVLLFEAVVYTGGFVILLTQGVVKLTRKLFRKRSEIKQAELDAEMSVEEARQILMGVTVPYKQRSPRQQQATRVLLRYLQQQCDEQKRR